jgi:spermidine/putrescine transport system substrate-binding protein
MSEVNRISRRGLLGGAIGLGALSATNIFGDLASANATGGVVRFANWSLYLDYDNKTKSYPTLDAFMKKTGTKVIYSETIDDNDTFTAKVAPQLQLKKDIGYDIVVLTDWMDKRWIDSGFAAKFTPANVPNIKNLVPFLQHPYFDPNHQYTLPWAGVIGGLAWNSKFHPKDLKTLDDLFAKENKGKIEVLSEMRDTIGLIMMWQGVDISKPFPASKFENAIDKLKQLISDGYIRQVKGQSYQEDLTSGDAVAVIGWSGDINQLNLQNNTTQYKFAVPESGGTFSTDNMMIPITAQNKAGAEAVINYYHDPVVAAQVANYINYVCPVAGAQQAMEKINPAAVNNPLIFPTQAMWNSLKIFRELTPNEQRTFSAEFQKASGNA